MQHFIKFSEGPTLELLMAGLEAYEGRRRTGDIEVETIGHLWGYRRAEGDAMFHTIEHASVSALAERDPSWVSAHPEALTVKASLARALRPELQFLGDFHTHPYTTVSEVTECKGWQYSDGDCDALMSLDDYWAYSDQFPVMIVLAVCRRAKVHESQAMQIQSNLWRFDVGEFRFWLSAAVGEVHSMDGRTISPRTHSNVHLRSLSLDFATLSGERLSHYSLET